MVQGSARSSYFLLTGWHGNGSGESMPSRKVTRENNLPRSYLHISATCYTLPTTPVYTLTRKSFGRVAAAAAVPAFAAALLGILASWGSGERE